MTHRPDRPLDFGPVVRDAAHLAIGAAADLRNRLTAAFIIEAGGTTERYMNDVEFHALIYTRVAVALTVFREPGFPGTDGAYIHQLLNATRFAGPIDFEKQNPTLATMREAEAAWRRGDTDVWPHPDDGS